MLSKGTPLSIVNQEIDLSLAGGVIDLAVSSDLLLVESKSDLFPVWFLVDIKTAKRERIGFAGEKGFFLANELGDRLKNGIRPTRVNSLGH